jgi:hypothetical protein
MTEPDLVRWYREQLEVYSQQLAIRDKQLAQVQRALDAANHKIRKMADIGTSLAAMGAWHEAGMASLGIISMSDFLKCPSATLSRDQYATETASWDGPPEPPSGSV